LPESNKSKKTLAIRSGSHHRGRFSWRPPKLPVALFEKWSILIRLTCPQSAIPLRSRVPSLPLAS
jgi:hypothetical protein